MTEIISFVIMGFVCRLLFWSLIIAVFKTKKLITLHPIFGFLAIAHYWSMSSFYSEYEYVNYILVMGFVLPELFQIFKSNKVVKQT